MTTRLEQVEARIRSQRKRIERMNTLLDNLDGMNTNDAVDAWLDAKCAKKNAERIIERATKERDAIKAIERNRVNAANYGYAADETMKELQRQEPCITRGERFKAAELLERICTHLERKEKHERRAALRMEALNNGR